MIGLLKYLFFVVVFGIVSFLLIQLLPFSEFYKGYTYCASLWFFYMTYNKLTK